MKNSAHGEPVEPCELRASGESFFHSKLGITKQKGKGALGYAAVFFAGNKNNIPKAQIPKNKPAKVQGSFCRPLCPAITRQRMASRMCTSPAVRNKVTGSISGFMNKSPER
jgi:hypothetical protein